MPLIIDSCSNVLFWGYFVLKLTKTQHSKHFVPCGGHTIVQTVNAEWSARGAARVLNQLHGGQWRNSPGRIRENNAVKTFETSFALKSVFCGHGLMDLTSIGVRILQDFLQCETPICMNFLVR